MLRLRAQNVFGESAHSAKCAFHIVGMLSQGRVCVCVFHFFIDTQTNQPWASFPFCFFFSRSVPNVIFVVGKTRQYTFNRKYFPNIYIRGFFTVFSYTLRVVRTTFFVLIITGKKIETYVWKYTYYVLHSNEFRENHL